MKASELRIGNWVDYECRSFKIHSLSEEIPTLNTIEFGFGVVDWGSLKPIPLTEEWLLKFGLEKYFYEENGLKLPWYKLHKNDFLFDIDYEFAYTRDDGGYIKVQYVHTLQNLYFALTGKELEIKEVQDGGTN